jgi:hypothetical protein
MHRLDQLLVQIRQFGPEFQISLHEWREFIGALDPEDEEYLMTAPMMDALDWVAVAVRAGRVTTA